jgi:hypothetical protein
VAVVAWPKAGKPDSSNNVAASAKYGTDRYLLIGMDFSLTQTNCPVKS